MAEKSLAAQAQEAAYYSLSAAGLRIKNKGMDDVCLSDTRVPDQDGIQETCIEMAADGGYIIAAVPLVDVAKFLLQFMPEMLERAQKEIAAGYGLVPGASDTEE